MSQLQKLFYGDERLHHNDRSWSVGNNWSGPNDMGSNCSSVMTTDLLSLSYMRMGVLGCTSILLASVTELPGPFHTHLAELSDELSTHSAGAGRRTDICRHSYRSDITSLCALPYISEVFRFVTAFATPYMLDNSRPNGCSLGASANWIC